jgi:dipeptidase
MKRFLLIFIIILATALLHADRNDNCFSIAIGTAASSDGSVILAHNEDDRGPYWVNVRKISPHTLPRHSPIPGVLGDLIAGAKETQGYIWLEIPDTDFADSFWNSAGVVIVSNACPSREDKPEISGSGIGKLLRRYMAAYTRSARQAVLIAGRLVEEYGYDSSGRTYTIADANEAWLLHIVHGKHWLAQRVPDDQVAVIANCYTIGRIDLADKKNFLGSADIASYAQQRGWYNPARDGEFDFARAYSDPRELQAAYNKLRWWRGVNLLAEKTVPVDGRLPFCFIPEKKIHASDLFRILRDHYENSEYDPRKEQKDISPNSTKTRTICTDSTQYSFVAQLRSWLPAEMANLAWIAFRRPDSNGYSPWYFSLDSVPDAYRWNRKHGAEKVETAFSYYERLSELVDRDYAKRWPTAQKVWKNFEYSIGKDMKNREKEFEYLVKTDARVARQVITAYVHSLEFRRWFLTAELLREFRQ